MLRPPILFFSVTFIKVGAAASIGALSVGIGWIYITTKKGKFNQPMKISVNTNTTISATPNLKYDRNYLPSADFIAVERILFDHGFYDDRLSDPTFRVVSPVVELLNRFKNGGLTQPELQASINHYNKVDVRQEVQKYFYRRGLNQQYNISASGGGKGATYYLSGGYDQNLGSQRGFDYSRLKFISQNMFRPIENLEISLGIDYTQTINHSDNALNGLISGGGYNTLYPYAQFTDPQGHPIPIAKDYRSAFTAKTEDNGFLNWTYVPLEDRDQYTGVV
jgi:hypothetical protein